MPLIKRRWFKLYSAPVVLGLLFLLGWQAIVDALKIPSYLLPTPIVILRSLHEHGGHLLLSMLVTLKVTLLAFVAAIIVGVAIAVLFIQSPLVERSVLPYVILIQVTPVVAVAPLIIILVDNTQWAMVICATVVAFFPIVTNTTIGLRSVDPGLLNFFKLSKATRWETLARLRLPSAMPLFFAGLRISSSLALIGAVVAEFVAGTGGKSAGLAFEILQAGFQLDIPRMFAALFLVTVLGILLFAAMQTVSRRVLGHWHESERG
jgi:NitT/TauT family transport system permease protein